jgi:hypothetical protein
MTAASIVAELRARGVTPEARGDNLHVRPTRLVKPEELEALRARKAEILVFLRSLSRAWVDLDPTAVHEAFGEAPNDRDLAILRFDVLAAISRLEVEIATGVYGAAPILVRGRPLGDWLDLGEVAELLRRCRVARRGPQHPSPPGG